MKFYVQHATAAVCNSNDTAGQRISCGRFCRDVEADNATVVESFVSESWTDIGGYVAVDDVREEIVLSIRGSSNYWNWVADFDIPFASCSSLVEGCKVHRGFASAWSELSGPATRAIQAARSAQPNYSLVFAGHSLGGAVASLAAAYFRQNETSVDDYTYGSPRVGNHVFANYATKQSKAFGSQYRVTHNVDIVPRLPLLVLGFRHISPEYWLKGGWPSQNDYPISSIRVCDGIANTRCNEGTWGTSSLEDAGIAHLHYFQPVSCGSSAVPVNVPDEL
ncbi:hypothetical protein MANI_023848 [Metarhizium anisopliae]